MSTTQPQPTYIKLEPNQPVTVALRYPTPTVVSDNFREGAFQLRWSLMEGKSLYTPMELRSEIEGVFKPGERFTIERRKEGKSYRFIVSSGSRAAALLDEAEALDTPVQPETIRKSPNPLASALVLAIEAAKTGEEHAQKIGRPVQFSASDIERMAVSLLIGQQQRRAA